MNILEAIDSLKQGNVIKQTAQSDKETFYIQVTIEPLHFTEVWEFEIEDLEWVKKRPESIGDCSYSRCSLLDMNAIVNGQFEQCSIDQMISYIQKKWDEIHPSASASKE